MIPRRRFLQVAAAASAAAVTLPATPSLAVAREPEGTLTDLGGPRQRRQPAGQRRVRRQRALHGLARPVAQRRGSVGPRRRQGHHPLRDPHGRGHLGHVQGGHRPVRRHPLQVRPVQDRHGDGHDDQARRVPDHFIWTMASSPDGKIYMGMSEPGRVVEYDPATGVSRDLGQPVAGESYVRSIQARRHPRLSPASAPTPTSSRSTGRPARSATCCPPSWPTATGCRACRAPTRTWRAACCRWPSWSWSRRQTRPTTRSSRRPRRARSTWSRC
ncbi:hypothetical protein [Nonomuraea dietziae]|uniref:hypothetical protein n=1 Tax=Nonomuraea dietziae TaxID=65515 RepID=UPI0031E42AC3